MSLAPRFGIALAALLSIAAGLPSRRAVVLEDVALPLRERLPSESRTAKGFDEYVASLHRETARRERDGEYEHLVYFLLQSQRFTREPRIEPALSAHELLGKPNAAKQAASDAVRRRVSDFARAVSGNPRDARIAYFKRFLEATRPGGVPLGEHLLCEYARTMSFLYAKEFLAKGREDPQEREAYIASLYQKRGHSTDTQIEANFAVQQALSVIKAQGGQRLDKVLIVGPGLDFAPRTDLVDAFEPQSYQPFAVADALLALGLSDLARLQIHCVDVNERVLDHFRGMANGSPLRLQLVSGIPERDDRPLEPEYQEYFARLGRAVGEEEPLLQQLPGRLGKSLLVRPEIVRKVTAGRLDIVTERYDPSPAYDLVVVTNVLGYFDPAQQALALSNIDAMLKDGGHLIHNEPQMALVGAAQSLGLEMSDARSVRLGASLFDRVLIHRKSSRKAAPNQEGV